MIGDYYDRQGRPLENAQWMKLWSQPAYRRVAETTLSTGRWVSTVWVGINTAYSSDDPPLIFEAMVFDSLEYMNELASERYATEEEAQAGHWRLCDYWSKEELA